jgi:fluoride exporter
MKDFFWISLGAILGANLRYLVSRFAARHLSAALPWGTLIVNVTGSFILGFFMIWVTDRVLADPRWRPLIAVGFCGGFTTFSSYSYETFSLLEQGHFGLAVGNFLGNNLLALAGVLGGAVVARAI